MPAHRRRLRAAGAWPGPVEATALGNVLVQARAVGVIAGGLAELRALLRATSQMRTYAPTPGAEAAWAAAAARIG